MTLKLSPKTISGVLHNQNKNSSDWGWQGQFAYGCQNLVVVVDPASVQVIQTLDKHKGYVVKVKWSKENYYHDLGSPYSLRLATADYNGKIIVWNVAQSSILSEFADSSKPVADMEWLSSQDASQDLLAVLHPPYSLILWNAATGTKLWKKSYTESLLSFSFDPFDPCKLAFLGQESILFVDDFSLSKTPSSNGRKYFISSPSSHNKDGVSQSTSSDKLAEKKNRSTIQIVSSIIVGGDVTRRSGSEEPETGNECLQLCYHQACRHHLILLYPREILILDLQINQTVGILPLERNGSPFSQLMSVRQRDVLLCLHENGCVTVRMRRKAKELPSASEFGDDAPVQSSVGVAYDLKCQSDSVRLTRHVKVYSVAVCPVTEARVAVLLSDGRVLIWKLTDVSYQLEDQGNLPSPLFNKSHQFDVGENLSTHPKLHLSTTTPYPKSTLADLLTPDMAQSTMRHSMSQSMIQSLSQSQLSEMADNNGGATRSKQLKFVLSGLLYGLAAPPFIVKMCPPLTTKNWAVYQPLMAVGNSSGNVQVYNMSGGYMTREFSVHTCPVRGIEWCSLHSFMSFAFTTPSSSGLVKNEITLTDIQSGRSTAVRTNRDEESPIEMIRVSHLKQYFVVVFKEKPFELWDLKSCTMLRQMPRHFPRITALEWSPSPGAKKKSLQDASVLSSSSMDLSVTTPSAETPTRGFQPKPADTGPSREHFVFTDTEGLLYHFLIEGNIVKDGSKIPPDGSMSTISSIAWKGETLVLGDTEGNLNIWDLKHRISKAVPTHKGWIKRMKFAPGRGNMKLLVLHTDSVEIWDTKAAELLSSVRTPKDIAKVTDADWVASDKPALACADGCLRVMDLYFKTGSSALSEYQLQEPVLSPYLLSPKAAASMKCTVQHQPWSDQYALTLEENDQNTEHCALVNEQLDLIDSELRDYLLNPHFGTAHRSLITARLFGDESDIRFWTVALHYMRAEKAEPSSQKINKSSSSPDNGDLFVPNTPVKETHDLLDLEGHNSSKSRSWAFLKDTSLETCFDVLCDNASFQKYQIARISLHDSKRVTSEHTRKCAENLMLLGQTDRAVQLLLETDAQSDSYYVDSLRACLVASIRSSGASQSTIKLVATNLIANGKLSEGVQLLCLIDKGLDACRYLQTYGEWHQAAWLAKATLEHSECKEVMKRWAENLSTPQVNRKSLAVLVMLSLGQFDKVLETLYSSRQFERAVLFIEACEEFGIFSDTADAKSIRDAVYIEYARFVLNLGNRKASEYYCHQAGQKGAQLLKEIVAAFTP